MKCTGNVAVSVILGLGMLLGSIIATTIFHFSKESFALKLNHCYVDTNDRTVFKVIRVGEHVYKILEIKNRSNVLFRNIKNPENIQEFDCDFIEWEKV